MNRNAKEYYADRILVFINRRGQIRVKDVTSWLYLNKDRSRRLLDWMVSVGYITKKTIKYAGNANMNVYFKK